jgi:DNA-binding transcriptional MerR regulator
MQAKPQPDLLAIPAKRYFTLEEVATLAGVAPHILRYWEQEFSPLQATARSGRLYYQRKDVLLARRIRHLLVDDGFTISAALQQIQSGDLAPKSYFSASEVRTELTEMLALVELALAPAPAQPHAAQPNIV